ETFLLEMSSLVKSLHINQLKCYGNRYQYLFGLFGAAWSHTILEMYSRKLDKLLIENTDHPYYLFSDCTDLLIAQLPLIEKKVWFAASFYLYNKGVSYKINNHVIQSSRPRVEDKILSIKHKSRLSEEF
ncbi:hypothetical protein PMAYCL1PPCAC_20550, partial [Pristionchus mayeri]